MFASDRLGIRSRRNGQWYRVTFVHSVAREHLNSHEEGRLIPPHEQRPVANTDGLKSLEFGPIPPLILEVSGEDQTLKHGPYRAFHQGFPAPREWHARKVVHDLLRRDGDFTAISPGCGFKLKPDETGRADGQGVRPFPDGREIHSTEHLDGSQPFEGGEVEFDRLVEAREVRHAEDQLVLVFAEVGEDCPILRVEELDGASAKDLELLPERDDSFHPVQEG